MFQSISKNELEFIKESISSNFRIDARGLHDYRNLDVKFGQENG